MKLTEEIVEMVIGASGKALATVIDGEPHVVPVSTVRVENNKIILVNYFMGQTIKNILENPKVSLACWKGLEGYQIKSTMEYITEGETFESIKEWISELHPDRTVLGVLSLTPNEIYDVSATATVPGVRIL
jgi:predicted pyridoxine 5'-phosphate oxidase superfamily flavin-nucleotide-binding protein